MTEAEWLVCESPGRMVEWLTLDEADGERSERWAGSGPVADAPVVWSSPRQPPSDRQLRLFACACCRREWDVFTDAWARRAVEVAERYADGGATHEEFWDARMAVSPHAYPEPDGDPAYLGWVCLFNAGSEAAWSMTASAGAPGPRMQAALLREIIGNPFREVTLCGRMPHETGEKSLFCMGCHDIRAANGHRVYQIARRAYDERDWGALPILADALEEGGMCGGLCVVCNGHGRKRYADMEDEEPDVQCLTCRGAGRIPHPLIAHLRSAEPHALGCWATDLILGKE